MRKSEVLLFIALLGSAVSVFWLTNERMHAAAALLLSGTQLERFDAVLQNELEREQAQVQMQLLRSQIDSGQASNAE